MHRLWGGGRHRVRQGLLVHRPRPQRLHHHRYSTRKRERSRHGSSARSGHTLVASGRTATSATCARTAAMHAGGWGVLTEGAQIPRFVFTSRLQTRRILPRGVGHGQRGGGTIGSSTGSRAVPRGRGGCRCRPSSRCTTRSTCCTPPGQYTLGDVLLVAVVSVSSVPLVYTAGFGLYNQEPSGGVRVLVTLSLAAARGPLLAGPRHSCVPEGRSVVHGGGHLGGPRRCALDSSLTALQSGRRHGLCIPRLHSLRAFLQPPAQCSQCVCVTPRRRQSARQPVLQPGSRCFCKAGACM